MLFSILFLTLLSSHTHATTLSLVTSSISTAESDFITLLLSNTSNTVPTSNTPAFPNSSSISSAYLDIPIGPITCMPPGPRFNRVIKDEYLENLEQIMLEEDAMSIRLWQLGGPNIIQWVKGSCIIALGAPITTPITGAFQPALVAHLAATIAKVCFADRANERRGGRIRFGAPMQLEAVLGAKMDPLVAGAES